MPKKSKKPITEGENFDIDVWCSFDKIVGIEELDPNPRNPNYHPQKQVDVLARIIKEQGWRNPITVSNLSGYIVKGHCRLLAAQALGLHNVPVDYQDYESELQEHADLIADNKIAELAKLDREMLADLLDDLHRSNIDETLSGYDKTEIDFLLDIHAEDAQEKFEEESDFEYKILIDCKDEEEQIKFLKILNEEKYKCRPLIS